ncbi:MAG: type IX secretion system membrane protein PorP/SprF [Flavobacteriales bacterium]|jgi:type IX secretion system PorP/SprF family membrane protein|nr:type IX secretion system membrane protein PorP/SprF [Flavobacteriales bacterium]|tara:strand:+ start:12991 stop:13899 length:909 start_codon:yes stop_codon:yes gene_type:complete
MKQTILLLSFALFFTELSAQQDAQFSQNMFNKLANNPGFAGSNQAISATGLFRSQWTGFEGAPTTTNLSIHAPIDRIHGGLGLSVITEEIASFENTSIHLSYAYQTQLGTGQLGIGLSLGMYQSGLDGSNLNPSQTGDAAIPTGEAMGNAFDLGAGLYYNTQDVYFGLSTAHITEPAIDWSDGQTQQLKQHYFLIAGSYHELTSSLSLNPSIYLKSDGSSSQLDINTNLIYNNKLWGGVSYRIDDGIVLLTGLEIMKDLKLGLAYDVVLSEIATNSFEVMLGYNFNIKVDTQLKKYKNPRFL